jgi:SpoVK/Ycf46/Vps4 family AAA+-type ATPase
MGTQLVKNHFKMARKHSPCIIFIDEIDSLTPRDKNMGYTAHLNQLLTEMDGFKDTDDVIVIGASNMEDSIDKALKRSGRFDLKIHIPLPWRKSRIELIKFFCEKQKVDINFDVDLLAKKTNGFSPADIKNLINIAKLNTIQNENILLMDNQRIKIDKQKLKNYITKVKKEKIEVVKREIEKLNDKLNQTSEHKQILMFKISSSDQSVNKGKWR